ncbi:MAG: helix-turn-helix transcriptional regulator [Saprospiraceae bacterium]|nr:helix-turn-helix transcriptional regulator [Saprospiraceae bacterium]
MKVSTKGKYYGTEDIEVSLGEIVMTQYDYTIETTPWHYHENPYFMFVLHGNMVDHNKQVETLLPTGSLMFNNWQEEHFGHRNSHHAAGFHLEFEKSWFKKKGVDLSIFEGSKLIQDPQVHLPFARLYHEFNVADEHSELSIELLLLQICDVMGTAKQFQAKGTPTWVAKLKEILHFDNADLTLQHLSQQLDVHPVHISRAVPKYLSVSLGEYIRQTKIKRAIPLLLDPSYRLTQVAYEAGFADQSHFNYTFKRYFGLSPGKYRKNLLNK